MVSTKFNKMVNGFFLDRDSVGNFNALIQISYTPVLLIYGTVSSFLTPIYFQKSK